MGSLQFRSEDLLLLPTVESVSTYCHVDFIKGITYTNGHITDCQDHWLFHQTHQANQKFIQASS